MTLGRVFISSVFGGLLDLRAAAAAAARLAGLDPVLTETHIAQPTAVRDALARELGACDTYLELFDRRRGTVPAAGTVDHRAITEEELHLARVPDLARLVEADEHHDLMNGTAGAAAALLVLAGLRPASGALDLARRCGKRLAASAVEMECGVAWPPGIEGERPLAGFSHGSAGIAWALLRLAAAADDRRLRELGLAAIDYERGLFDPVARNWRDFRRFGTTVAGAHALDPLMAAWCNGAAGIGLARLGTLPLLDDAAVRGEIAAALSTTLARGFGKTHCLCHGDLGNIELLLTAARRLGRPELEERAYRLAGGVLADIRNGGWRLGMPRGSEPPGLMVGLAGVGYGLLRLAAPEQVPAVLLLEGPRVPS